MNATRGTPVVAGAAALCAVLLAVPAAAQQPAADRITLGQLKAPVHVLSREETEKLLAGAGMQRINQRGAVNTWTNRPDGKLYILHVTRSGRTVTQPGEWKINEQGQYCLTVPWHNDTPESWCRHLVKNEEGHFFALGLAPTDRVRKYEITPAK
jgi:hypothetical protein